MIERRLTSLTQTEAFGARLAGLLRAGDVVALRGELGAGKTTLARSLISAIMGAPTEVPSPTYTIIQTYQGPDFEVFHLDLYRLEDEDEVFELGWDELQDGAALIEWPDRAGRHLPGTRLDVTLVIDADARVVRLEPRGEDWHARLHDLE